MTNTEKAKQLLKQMTLTEKIGQLVLCAGCNVDDKGVPDSFDLVKLLKEGKCGSVIVQPQDMSEAVDFMQKIAVEESRLHIPLFINCDMIHGFETVFPIPLAAACSFDTELIKKCAEMSAREAYACGVRYTNAPMLDVSRDPRWGRIAESQGEDPYLAGEIVVPYILAEEPDLTSKEVLKKSEEMMDGHKMEYFKLLLSFFGWFLISIFTLGIAALFYVNPWVDCTKAEYYRYLKEQA